MFLVNLFDKFLIVFIIYISGWLMFLKPIIEIINCSNITGSVIVCVILKVLFSIPVAKFLYAIGAMIALKLFT